MNSTPRQFPEEKEKPPYLVIFHSYKKEILTMCTHCPSFRISFLLSFVLLNGPPPWYTVTHYSTHLNDQPEIPVFKKGDAFLFKYQAVTSESENKVRVFSLFPKIPDINLTGTEDLSNLAKIRRTGIGGMYVQNVCEFQ